MSKKKFHIALDAQVHRDLKLMAAEGSSLIQGSSTIGGTIEHLTKLWIERVNEARENGEIPKGVRASTLDLGQLLLFKDQSKISEHEFKKEINELTPKPGDERWTTILKST